MNSSISTNKNLCKQLPLLCAALKINGSKIYLMVWSLFSINDMLMTCLYCFLFSISLRHQYFCEKGKFVTNVCRKKTFSGVYISFNSVIPEPYKTGLIKQLLLHCFSLCLDFLKLYHEVNVLKGILYKNSYPRDFVDKCVKKFLDGVLAPEIVVSAMPKKGLMIVLPHLVKRSLQIRNRINHVMKKATSLLQFFNCILDWVQVDQFFNI